MPEWIGNWIGALILAWGKQMRLPLPDTLKKWCSKSSRGYEMAGFVLLGALGALAVLLAAMLSGMVLNRWGGALVFALLGWFFMLFHDHARGDGLISSFLADCLPGENIPYWVVLPVMLTVLKFALLMLLFFFGRGMLLTLIFAGAFGVEVLMQRESLQLSGMIDFDSAMTGRRFWTVFVLILIVNFVLFPLGSALIALVIAFWWRLIGEKSARKSACTMDDVRFGGAAVCLLGLIAGALTV